MALNLPGFGAPKNGAIARTESDAFPAGRLRRLARILAVDDEPHVRSMIGATLERQGFDVQLAASGREALEMLERSAFDLVLTDIVMQDGNGIALLDRIHGQQPQLPVVMVTAIHDISVAIDSMRRGAYDYLLKPFEREHLVSTVSARSIIARPCRTATITSRISSRWSAPEPKCCARRWRIWSIPTT